MDGNAYDDVRYDTRAGVATVRIDRPAVKNAFDRNTIAELNDALARAEEDDGVYVVVFAGTDGAFCAGADVSDMPNWSEGSLEDYAGYLWAVQNVVRRLREMPVPTIASVSGPAVGAGCDFALACDLRVISPDAFLREGFVRIGLVPGDGGGWLLPRLVGEAKAREYLLTGRDITPADAVDLGLAVEVADDPEAAARDLATEIRDLPALAVQRTKELIDPEATFEDYCERAIAYQWECVNDAEHREAVAAFAERREPEYDREYDD